MVQVPNEIPYIIVSYTLVTRAIIWLTDIRSFGMMWWKVREVW